MMKKIYNILLGLLVGIFTFSTSFSQTTVTVGSTVAGHSGVTSTGGPFGSSRYNMNAMGYAATDINTSGWIQSISFETVLTGTSATLNGVSIYMRPMAANGVLTTTPSLASTYQLVYSGSVSIGAAAGFATTINLQTRYLHNSANGLEVLMIRDHGATYASTRAFVGGTIGGGPVRNLRYASTTTPYSPAVTVQGFLTRFNAQIVFAGPRTICTGTPPTPSLRNTTITLTGGCPSATVLQAHGHSTDSLVSYQWEQSTDGGSSWANAVGGSGANNPVFTTPAISANIQYRFKTTCSGVDAISPVCTVNASTTLGAGIPRTISTAATLPLTCQQRVTFTATGGTTTGVVFQWEMSNDGGVSWVNSDGGWNNTNGGTHTTANIHGTTRFRLRSTCSEGGSPTYSNEIEVTTNFGSNISSYPWTENFSSLTAGGQVPCGWTVINAKQTGQNAPIGNTWGARSSTFGTGFNTVTASFPGVSMGYQWASAAINANDWLITRPFTFNSTKQYVLGFDAMSVDQAFPEALEIWVGSQPTIASLSAGIQIFDNNSIATTKTTYFANGFMVPTTGTYYIGLRVKSQDRWILQMDDFSIVQNDPCTGAPTASIPTGNFQTCTGYQYTLAATGASTGATIVYEWQQSTNGGSTWTAAQGTGVNTLNFTSNPLTQNTSFRFRAFCGNSGQEFLSNAANVNLNSFSVSSFPYYDNFDNNSIVSPPLMPCGWTMIDGNSDGTIWNRNSTAANSASAPNHVSYTFSGANTANDWIITPALPLITSKKYTVGLRFATSASAEQFEIRWGSAPTIAAMTNTIYVNNAVGNTSYDTATATSFIVPSAGTYYVGIYCKSPANLSTLRIDNFGIKADDICTGPITGVTASALRTNVCNGGSTTFSLSGANASLGLSSYRWQVSANGVSFNNTGLTTNDTSATYVASNITTPRFYRCQITCLTTGDITFTNNVQISIVTPTVPTVTGATRCGTGQVSLFATVPSGLTYWANPSGGPVLSTSNNYGPTISATTTFRAGNIAAPFNTNFGPQVLNGTMTGIGNYVNILGQNFDVLNPNGVWIKSIDFRATQPIGTAYRILIKNSSGTVIATVNGNTTAIFPNVQSGAPINVWLPQGTGYLMEPAAGFNPGFTGYTGGATYPYTVPNMISITGNNSGTPNAYFYFFNWQIQDGCYSNGASVTGTVTQPIAQVNIVGNPANGEVCSGNTATLNATTTGMSVYSWFPSNVDVVSGANGPILTVLPTGDRTYIVTAHDGNPNLAARCISVDTFQINLNTAPTGVNNSPTIACLGTPVGLLVAGASLYKEQIGFGTDINSQIFGSNALSNVRSQMLFTKAELNAAGFNGAGFISAISFKTSSMNNAGVAYTGFRIGMRNVSNTNLNTGTVVAGTDTTAYLGFVNPTSNTTLKITFSTPFFWNGNGSLLISTCYASGFGLITNTTRDFVFGTTDPINVMAHFATAAGCNATGAATAMARPNLVFHGGPVTYTWAGAPAALSLLSATNVANPSLSATAVGTLNYTVTVTDGAGCIKTVPVSVNASQPGTWLGGTSTDLSNPANWLCGVLPTASTSVTVPSAPNPLVINSNVAYNNFTISSGGSVTLNNPGSITVSGNWTNNGSASMNGGTGSFVDNSDAGVFFTGGSKNISGFTTFRNIRVRQNSTRTVQSGATVGFLGTLTLAPDSNSAWVNNGSTILRSNASRTGILNKVTGSSSYTGTLGVERWVSPITSQATGEYYMMGSCVDGRTLANWQAFAPMSGFPGASINSSNPSVWFYNPNGPSVTAGWEAPTDITNPTPIGKGMRIFLRKNGFFNNGPGRTLLTGNPQIGTFTFDNTNLSFCPSGCPGVTLGQPNGWNMIANPLPSPINWATAHTSGNAEVGKTIYIWRQSQSNYASYNPLTLVSLLSGDPIINSGQGFFIETFGNSPSLTISENDKIIPEASVPFLRTGTANIPPRVKMRMNFIGQDDIVDEAAVVFYNGASMNFDRQLDARKVGGTVMSLSLITPDNTQLGANAIETPTVQTVIPMRVHTDQPGMFGITISEVLNLPAGMTLFIRDKFINTLNQVTEGSTFRFAVSSNPASLGDRFELILVPASVSGTDLNVKSAPIFEVFPNPSNSSTFNFLAEGLGDGIANIAITDQIGRVVYTTKVELLANDAVQSRLNTNLPRGIYNVSIETGSRKVVRKMIIE